MKHAFLYPLLTLSLFLGGCLPEERIWWSPDGQVAAVLVKGALYLSKPDGELGPPLAEWPWEMPAAISWLPDGSGFVLYRERMIKTWKEFSKLIPGAERSQIETRALGVPALLKGAGRLPDKKLEAAQFLFCKS